VSQTALAAALQDRYRLERELGQGGMATVYLAHDLRNNRPVALKVLRPELAAILGAERFLKEIETTANLQHPHILPLFDSGEAGAFLFYVMPFVEGESLRQRLAREKQLSLDDALRLTTEVTEALDYAHQQGVIHRDIKPENILLSRGHALVADFGIALAVTQAGGGRLTETGLSLGTPAYMSPEQAMAEADLDPRADQYSLACVLYEMLAGEPPYSGPTPQAIIAKRLREPIPHLSTVREVPAEVEHAVMRALAKRPADRFGTVAEFAAALERPGAAKRFVTRRMAALLGGVAVLGVIALLAWLFRPATPPQATAHRQVTFSGRSTHASLSPDHRWLAYVDGQRILVRDLGSTAAPVSIGSAPWWGPEPRWKQDGSILYFQKAEPDGGRTSLNAVAWPGGVPRAIPNAWCGGLTVAQRGGAFLCSSETDSIVRVLDPATGASLRQVSLAPMAQSVGSIALSPAGNWLAFVSVRGGATFLALSRADGSRQRRLVDNVPRYSSLAWSPSGEAIYYLKDLGNGGNFAAAGEVMRLRIDPRTGEPHGPPTAVMSGEFVREFSLTPDGSTLAYVKAPPQQRIWAMTFDGPAAHPAVRARELTPGTAVNGTPDISPDGRWVAFARNDGGNGNIYVTPFDSFAPRPVVDSPHDEWSPRWSPDGARLAYTTRDSGGTGIFILTLSSGEVRQVSAATVAPLGTIAWTPDGRRVVFPLDLGFHYARVDLTTGATDTMATPDSMGFRETVYSPDGNQLAAPAMAKHREGNALVRGTSAWSGWTPLGRTRPGIWESPVRWTNDGWIYSVGTDSGLWRVRDSGGDAVAVAELPRACSFWQTSLSADARRMVCTVEMSEPDIWIAEPFDPEMQK
jgi:serine/threonine-protein kinase